MGLLLELIIVWTGILISNFFAKRVRLTPVLFYLFFGALFVNVGLISEHPSEFLEAFAEVGIILIMFALGFEENTTDFIKGIKRSWGIAFFGGLAPFITAYTVADFTWGNPNISLVIGLAMTATAVSLTLVSLKSEGLSNSPAATGIMTSAVLDDIASLALVAIIIPIVTGTGEMSTLGVLTVLGKALLFFVSVAVVSAWILPGRPFSRFKRLPIIGSYGLGQLFRRAADQQTLLVLIFIMAVAECSLLLGLHPAVGAYMAGLILKEDYFGHLEERVTANAPHLAIPTGHGVIKSLIDNVAFVWIGPIFFVLLGTKIIFDLELLISVLPTVALLTGSLIVAQTASAALAARYTGGFSGPESLLIGLGMLGRAELAFVVLDIAYVDFKVIPEDAFYTLMVSAFLLNCAVPLSIRWWKGKFANKSKSTASNPDMSPS